MAQDAPRDDAYLAVVSEWTRTTQRGGVVGNAYPLMNLTTGSVVSDPNEEFPNPGAVFLTSRGSLRTWDYVLFQRRDNSQYRNHDQRECFYIPARQPELLQFPNQADHVAVILEHPSFDPTSPVRQIQNPQHNVTPIFFIKKQQHILGPLIRDFTHLSSLEDVQRIDWRPAHSDGVVYEFTEADFAEKGIRLVKYSHPQPYLNRVLAADVTLAYGPVLKMTSQTLHDALPDASLLDWYLGRCPAVELTSQQLLSLKSSFRGSSDNEAIQSSRLKKIDREIVSNIAFAEQRERFAKQYLDSEAGQKRVRELIEQAVTRKASEIQSEVDKRQSMLAAKRDELDQKLCRMTEEHQHQVDSLRQERTAVEEDIDKLKSAIVQLQDQLVGDVKTLASKMQEQLPLFAALITANGDQRSSERIDVKSSRAAQRSKFQPASPTSKIDSITTESKLVDDLLGDLGRQGLHFARDFVANVYVCLKSEPLNLISGPPGYGKSTLISAMARSLGHGDAFLRIAVRRTWSDDRHILGFFDSFHGHYDAGPTGLVPRMLQADADWRKDQVGVYFVLLDEFNLASPEYYFSQLLQSLPIDNPIREVQLYDESNSRDDAFPSRVTIAPNLRFWGTINHDETTERLSPRTLDRTGMIFLRDADVIPTGEEQTSAMSGVPASDLFKQLVLADQSCPDEHWELVSEVLDCLRSSDPSLGPRVELSPRVQQAIKRYLANATGVLDLRPAVDFVVQQRILPMIRGQGENFVTRINRLQKVLSDANLLRSAAHVEDVLRRSDQHFGDLDFLSY